MIELLLVAVVVIGGLMWYIKRLRTKNDELERTVRHARRATDYREKEADYTRKRLEQRDEYLENINDEDYSRLFGPNND